MDAASGASTGCAQWRGRMTRVLHVIFFEPRIPGNSGAAIRLSANTGAMLHLIDPLFDMDDVKLRRAGLDYHDLRASWRERVLGLL